MNNKTITKSVCLKNRSKSALFPEITVPLVKRRQQLIQPMTGRPYTIEQKILFVSSFLRSESVLRRDLMRVSS